jgi:hypothetical protein
MLRLLSTGQRRPFEQVPMVTEDCRRRSQYAGWRALLLASANAVGDFCGLQPARCPTATGSEKHRPDRVAVYPHQSGGADPELLHTTVAPRRKDAGPHQQKPGVLRRKDTLRRVFAASGSLERKRDRCHPPFYRPNQIAPCSRDSAATPAEGEPPIPARCLLNLEDPPPIQWEAFAVRPRFT